MIYRLQRRFILICTVSVLSVIVVVFVLMTAFNINSMNRNVDILADGVSEGGGRFPDRFHEFPPPRNDSENARQFDFITPETPFATRHFTVWYDRDGQIVRINTESIHSVTEEKAAALAAEALAEEDERGWISNYRYKVFKTEGGRAIVFIDGSMNRSALMQSVTISALVLLGCASLVMLLVVLLSKRAVKPIAESYEKQRQFVTDANHELKTPLTLILANLDIAENELGENEWLDDIRSEGQRMTGLVNQLVELSRMDEDSHALNVMELPLGEIVADTASDFKGVCESRGKSLNTEINTAITYQGEEMLIRRLISILLDNAVKYCDEGGEISVTLEKRRRTVLKVENTYASVGAVELDKLFDRFYRSDRARTFTGGYGVGLSIAKSIAEKHKGEIVAYKKDDTHIGFKVTL